MKKLLSILVFSIIAIALNAQYEVENIFRKYKNDSGVIAWQFSGDISGLLNRGDGEPIKSTIKSVDFFMFSDGGDISDSDQEKLSKKINADNFEMLIQARDKGQKIKVMGIENGESITKVFAQVTFEEMNGYFFLEGDLFLEDLQNLEFGDIMNGAKWD